MQQAGAFFFLVIGNGGISKHLFDLIWGLVATVRLHKFGAFIRFQEEMVTFYKISQIVLTYCLSEL